MCEIVQVKNGVQEKAASILFASSELFFSHY